MSIDDLYPESGASTWESVGFDPKRVWRTERTELDGPIEKGIEESVRALEEPKENYSIP